MSEAQTFHNARPPQWTINTERARHRLACQMCINGFTNNQIAEALNLSIAWVSQILRQPWAVDYMAQEMQDKGDEMREKIVAEANKAFAREVKLAETAKSEAVKHQANTYLIDRYLGKPTQPIEEINKKPIEMSDDELRKALPGLLKTNAARSAPITNGFDNEVNTTSEPFPLENGFSS